jgi:hypothetical protein
VRRRRGRRRGPGRVRRGWRRQACQQQLLVKTQVRRRKPPAESGGRAGATKSSKGVESGFQGVVTLQRGGQAEVPGGRPGRCSSVLSQPLPRSLLTPHQAGEKTFHPHRAFGIGCVGTWKFSFAAEGRPVAPIGFADCLGARGQVRSSLKTVSTAGGRSSLLQPGRTNSCTGRRCRCTGWWCIRRCFRCRLHGRDRTV